MARRTLHKLTAAEVKAAKKPGAYEDGGGLRLVVDESGAKRWVQRLTIEGKRTSRGLGSYPSVTLEAARDKAIEARKALRNGDLDALATRISKKSRTAQVTFKEAFKPVYDAKAKRLTNAKALAQWQSTMDTYVFPTIGDLPLDAVEPSHIMAVLEPIWWSKPETAKRVLQRIETTFKRAIVARKTTRASPCIGVSATLGDQGKIVEHHKALPFSEVPHILKSVKAQPSVTGLCLRFLILTATRSIEARGAQWSEIDIKASVWHISPDRMKRRLPHRVPLSTAAVELLNEIKTFDLGGNLIFPSPITGGLLSDTGIDLPLRKFGYDDRADVHGFRSSFKEWCDRQKVEDHISERALAHIDTNETRAAYRRSDFFEERAKVMEDWGIFCLTGR